MGERTIGGRRYIDGGIRTRFISLTSAEVKALRATPKQLVPPPGAGKINEYLGARLIMDYGGTNAFTESADNLAIKYTDGSGAQVSEDCETTGFLDQTADTVTFNRPKNDAIVTAAGSVNKPLVLHNTGDGEFAGNAAANNKLLIMVNYRINSTRL